MFLKRIILFASLFLSVFSACNKPNQLIELPFTFGSHINLPIVFDGDTVPFVFDTGSTLCSLNQKFIRKAQLKSTSSTLVHFSNQSLRKCPVYEDVKIKIGSEKVSSEKVFKSDNKPIVGMDVISQFYWLFDLNKKKVLLSRDKVGPPSSQLESFKIYYDLNLHNGTMSTYVDFGDSIKYKLLIDTGYAKAHTPTKRKSKKFVLVTDLRICSDRLKKYLYTQNHIYTEAIDGSGSFYIFPKFKMNNTQLNYLCIFSAKRPSKGFDAQMNLNFFERFDQVYINPKEQYIEFFSDSQAPHEIEKTLQKVYQAVRKRTKKHKTTTSSEPALALINI